MIFYLNRDSNHWNELFVTWLLIDARLFDYYCGNNWHNSYLLFSRSLSLCLSLSRLYSIDYSLTFFLLLLDDTLDLMTVQRLVARANIYYIIMVVVVVVVVEVVGPRRLYLPRVVLPSNKLVSKWRRRRPAVEAAAAVGGLLLVVVVQRIKSRLWEIDNYTAWKKNIWDTLNKENCTRYLPICTVYTE